MGYQSQPTLDAATRSGRSTVINHAQPLSLSLLDKSNNAAATIYLPSEDGQPMGVNDDMSLEGKLEDADGDIDLWVEVSNDEDRSGADSWHNVTYAGMLTDRSSNNTNQEKISCSSSTEKFAIDFDKLNNSHFRVKMTFSGASNFAAVKARLKMRGR